MEINFQEIGNAVSFNELYPDLMPGAQVPQRRHEI